MTPHPIDAGVRIGHVHLKVADLGRAIAFYCGVLAFELYRDRDEADWPRTAGGALAMHTRSVISTIFSRKPPERPDQRKEKT